MITLHFDNEAIYLTEQLQHYDEFVLLPPDNAGVGYLLTLTQYQQYEQQLTRLINSNSPRLRIMFLGCCYCLQQQQHKLPLPSELAASCSSTLKTVLY